VSAVRFTELAANLDQMEATSKRNELVRILSEVYRACSVCRARADHLPDTGPARAILRAG